MQGTIVKVSGPLIVASGMADVQMFDVVRVSEKHLIGEVIELREDKASIQVYEETGGIGPGERDGLPVLRVGGKCAVVPGVGIHCEFLTGSNRPVFLTFKTEENDNDEK